MVVFPVSSDVHVATHAVLIDDVPVIAIDEEVPVPAEYVPLSSFAILLGST